MASPKVYLIIAIALMVVVLCGAWRLVTSKQSSTQRLLRQQVVAGIKNGSIVVDGAGIARLPPGLGRVSVDGIVYVTQKSGGATLVLFPEWRGKGSNLEGKLFWPNAPSPLPQMIEVVGPYVPMHPGDPLTGTVDLDLEGSDGANWYVVSFRGN